MVEKVGERMNDAVFSSKSIEWETPQAFFDALNRRFGFSLDVCATRETAKCPHFFDKSMNGLAQSWANHRCYMTRDRRMGREGPPGSGAGRFGGRATPGENRHEMVARARVRTCRCTFCSSSAQIRKRGYRSAVPVRCRRVVGMGCDGRRVLQGIRQKKRPPVPAEGQTQNNQMTKTGYTWNRDMSSFGGNA